MSEAHRFLVTCNVHEGGIPLRRARVLQDELRRVYRKNFGNRVKVRFIWMEIPKGQGFVAGEPSRLSAVLSPVPDGISQADRERFMTAVCDRWRSETGCAVDEIMVSAPDASFTKRYLEASRQRFHPDKARALGLKLFLGMLFGWPRKRYLTTTLNMPSVR